MTSGSHVETASESGTRAVLVEWWGQKHEGVLFKGMGKRRNLG